MMITRESVDSLVRHNGRSRRANGRGTIEFRESNNRPYMARVKKETIIAKGKKRIRYSSIGSFKTRAQAEKALEEYLINPYDLSSKIKSFSDLYEAWFDYYFRESKSASWVRSIENAYRYCSPIYNMSVRDIYSGHIKDLISDAYRMDGEIKKMASLCVKETIKSMCNMMFDYALERNIVVRNPSREFNITEIIREIESKKKIKRVFNKSDILTLWENVNSSAYVDMVLFGIYTGFRPVEICKITVDNVYLDEKIIVGGMKTEYGTNRRVPINPEIFDLVKKKRDDALANGSRYLFFKLDSYTEHTYNSYRHRFNSIMSDLEFDGFSPHCTRHTFATMAEDSGMKPRALKLIMGHSQRMDITNNVYIHTDDKYLYNEICKIRIREVSNEGNNKI